MAWQFFCVYREISKFPNSSLFSFFFLIGPYIFFIVNRKNIDSVVSSAETPRYYTASGYWKISSNRRGCEREVVKWWLPEIQNVLQFIGRGYFLAIEIYPQLVAEAVFSTRGAKIIFGNAALTIILKKAKFAPHVAPHAYRFLSIHIQYTYPLYVFTFSICLFILLHCLFTLRSMHRDTYIHIVWRDTKLINSFAANPLMRVDASF